MSGEGAGVTEIDKLMALADSYAEELSGPCPYEAWYVTARLKLREALVEALAEKPADPLAAQEQTE